jgi:hypothetical protein
MLSSPNVSLINARVSVPLFQRFGQNFMHTRHQIYYQNCVKPDTIPNRTKKISMSTPLRKILYTDSQDTLVLLSTVASRYNNWQHQSWKLWITPCITTLFATNYSIFNNDSKMLTSSHNHFRYFLVYFSPQ